MHYGKYFVLFHLHVIRWRNKALKLVTAHSRFLSSKSTISANIPNAPPYKPKTSIVSSMKKNMTFYWTRFMSYPRCLFGRENRCRFCLKPFVALVVDRCVSQMHRSVVAVLRLATIWCKPSIRSFFATSKARRYSVVALHTTLSVHSDMLSTSAHRGMPWDLLPWK